MRYNSIYVKYIILFGNSQVGIIKNPRRTHEKIYGEMGENENMADDFMKNQFNLYVF